MKLKLFFSQRFLCSDVNETPQILCKSPFYASTSFSRGSVLGRIQNYDPDNELYYSSKKRNPKGPFEIQKQVLNYRFENENISWPFDVTLNGIIYLEKVGFIMCKRFIPYHLPYHTIP